MENEIGWRNTSQGGWNLGELALNPSCYCQYIPTKYDGEYGWGGGSVAHGRQWERGQKWLYYLMGKYKKWKKNFEDVLDRLCGFMK